MSWRSLMESAASTPVSRFDDPADGPVPGIVGTFGVGATMWDRSIPRSTYSDLSVERMAVMAKGVVAEFGSVGGLAVHDRIGGRRRPGGAGTSLSRTYARR